MTAETEPKVDAGEIQVEKCGLDMSLNEDLTPPTVGGVGCSGDGKDDYIFIESSASDASSEDPAVVQHVNEISKVSELNIKFHETAAKGGPCKPGAILLSEDRPEAINTGLNLKAENEVRNEGRKKGIENRDGIKTERNVGAEVFDPVNENEKDHMPGIEVCDDGKKFVNANVEHNESENKVAVKGWESATENGVGPESEIEIEFKDGELVLQDVGGYTSDSMTMTENGDSHRSGNDVGGKMENSYGKCDKSESKVTVDDSKVAIEKELGAEAEGEVKVQEHELALEDGGRYNMRGIKVEDIQLENQDTLRFDSLEVGEHKSEVHNGDRRDSFVGERTSEGAPAFSLGNDVKPRDPLGLDNIDVGTIAVAAENTGCAVMEPELEATGCEAKDLHQLEYEVGPQTGELDAKALNQLVSESKDKEQQPLEDEGQNQSAEALGTHSVEDDHILKAQSDEIKKLQPLDGELKDPHLPEDEDEPPKEDSHDLQMKQPLSSVVIEALPSNGKVWELHDSPECNAEVEKHIDSEASVVLSRSIVSEDSVSESVGCNFQQSKDAQFKVTDQKDPDFTHESETETTQLNEIEKQSCLGTATYAVEGNDAHATDAWTEISYYHVSNTMAEENQDSEDTDVHCHETAAVKKPELTIEVIESPETKMTGVQSDAFVGPLITEKEKVEEERKLENDTDLNQETQVEVTEDIHYAQIIEEPMVEHLNNEAVSSGSSGAESGKMEKIVRESSKVEIAAADDPAGDDSAGDGETVVVNYVEVMPQLCGSSDDRENGVSTEVHYMEVPIGGDKGLPISSYVDKSKESGHADSSVAESCLLDTSYESEVHSSDVKDGNGVLACGAETEVKNGPRFVENESTCFANGLCLGSKISFGSFDCEEYAANYSQHDVNTGSQISSETVAACTRGSPIVAADSSKSKLKGVSSQEMRDLPRNESISSHYVENGGEKHDVQICDEAVGTKGSDLSGGSTSSAEGLVTDALESQNVSAEMESRPFHYLIRIPRYDDGSHREQIGLAETQVEERTKGRDAVRVEFQRRRFAFQDLKTTLEAARSEERQARDLVRSKRQEIDFALSVINRAKTALTIEDAGSRVLELERRIQHETLPLNEEKQLIRDIKQLKRHREQFLSNVSEQLEIQQVLAQKDKVEEQLKVLRKEMDDLREKLVKAEAAAKVAKKNYEDESAALNDLNAQFRYADAVRQEAYVHLQSLRKQWSEKNKYFRSYKDKAKTATDYVAAGDKKGLQRHCVNQVESFMALWNKNDKFRREYTRCNSRSTLRRLRTLDGRALGLDEETHPVGIVSHARDNAAAKINLVALNPTVEHDLSRDAKKVDIKSSEKVEEVKNQKATSKKVVKPLSTKNNPTEAPSKVEVEEEKKELKLSREEEELDRKEDELRRKEEAARLKEHRRLEEKAKAQEALERKRRNSEKAQARAEFRARKEAEEKEKEREKRARRKQKKKAVKSDTQPADAEIVDAPHPESPPETIKHLEAKDKPTAAEKRSQRPSIKVRSIPPPPPPPLRNRSRRRMQQWIWVFVIIVSILALFFLGDSKFFFNNRILSYNDTH